MTRVGMDPAEMTRLADEFERTAREINGLVFRVNGNMHRGVLEWCGDAAREYTNAWNLRSKAGLLAIELELMHLAGRLHREIADQTQTSRAPAAPPASAARLTECQSATYDGGKLRITAGPTYNGHGPTSVSDLLDPLKNDKHGHSNDPHGVYHYPGGIAVSFTGAPPDRHAVVTISGTETFTQGGTNIDDQTTNNGNALGLYTEKEAAIEQALLRSGVTPTDSIMLVGHSQGGADAIAFSHDYAKDQRFHVASIVTVGAPDAPKNPPGDVDVLELRGTNDVVPDLGFDLIGPGASVHRVWVPESPFSSPFTAHDPSYYQQNLPASTQLEAFEHRQAGFFGGGPTTTTLYANERVR